MMLDKRLVGTVGESKKYIIGNVLLQWVSLIANIAMIFTITNFINSLFIGAVSAVSIVALITGVAVAILVRYVCTVYSSKMGYLSSKTVKRTLRELIYEKLLKLGTSYNEKVSTSQVVQMSVEGVDQLETYFGAYLPQFFYSLLAPITLFIVLSFVSFKSAVVLLICVPLIPVSIAAVQTFAKKLLSKYWGQYTALGDSFLENLQGLTTLKIYQSDEYKNQQMNKEAESFRKVTMRVLTMQLNSIIVMDIIAYGGAALGLIMAVTQFRAGAVSMAGCLAIILLSAEFFIPMRRLGSFFHIAMNGMAASDKIFKLLDLEEPLQSTKEISDRNYNISCSNLRFSYTQSREILKSIDLNIPQGKFTAIVGESGCGKSTIASLLMGKNKIYDGSIKIGETELADISEQSLMKNITYVSHKSYLFKGTVKDNLLMASPHATDSQLWQVLEQVNLSDFLKSENGLETMLTENASNISGGQCQRLALARALLHDSSIYIFDEATSNIDVESENDILKQIHKLTSTKTVLLISHRLANVVGADTIYVMDSGKIVESGNHSKLIHKNNIYHKLWDAQQALENYTEVEATKWKNEAI